MNKDYQFIEDSFFKPAYSIYTYIRPEVLTEVRINPNKEITLQGREVLRLVSQIETLINIAKLWREKAEYYMDKENNK